MEATAAFIRYGGINMSITHEPERLIEKKNNVFYATDYTGYMVTTITNKFDFPLINCIEKLWEYEELEAQGRIKLCK